LRAPASIQPVDLSSVSIKLYLLLFGLILTFDVPPGLPFDLKVLEFINVMYSNTKKTMATSHGHKHSIASGYLF
jgi:hypothetical protein